MCGDQDCHLALNHAVEIIGKVDGNLHVKVQAATDFGTELGNLSYNYATFGGGG